MDQISIITQMFENLSDHEKSEFLKYLKADKTNQKIKSSTLCTIILLILREIPILINSVFCKTLFSAQLA